MSAGIITSSGTLGILIPPSIMLVVYAGLTGLKETSVGNLFAAAILPGLLLSGLLPGLCRHPLRHQPEDSARRSRKEERTATFGQKCFMFVKSLVPPFGLILAVMGTILAGVATPTEAAALGATGAMVLALFKTNLHLGDDQRRLARPPPGPPAWSWPCSSAARCSAWSFSAWAAATWSRTSCSAWISSPIMVLFLMNLVVFILGMFIDWAAILLVVVPIFTPIAMELDFDPLWFAMILCVNLQTSFLTPPFGYSLFYFKGAAPPEYTIGDVYKGIIPFIGLQLVVRDHDLCLAGIHHLSAVGLLRRVIIRLTRIRIEQGETTMLPKIKTILYATGLGPGAPYVFRYALALARQHGAKIVAVHGMEPLSDFGQSLVEQYISHEDSEEMHRKARETVKAQLADRIRQLCTKECDGATECENVVTSIKIVEG